MSRPIVLGNGELHVGINEFGLVHDFYFPYVGFENHVLGRGLRHRIGVWVDGRLSWLDDGSWSTRFDYPHQSLVGRTRVQSASLGIMLEFHDAVDAELNVFMRAIHVINQHGGKREIRLFMHQAFVIGDSRGNTDTAQYLPDTNAIMHYRGRRVFLVGGEANEQPFDQYSVGLFGIEGHEGSWKDAENGELSGSTSEHGRVDSVMRFKFEIDAHSSDRASYWIAAGTSLRSAIQAHKKFHESGIDRRLMSTASWWQQWLKPVVATADQLPRHWQQQFIVSAMILRSHMDNRGAIIASTDSSMLNYGRDAYAYCWPRDGAFISWPLIRLGYEDEAMRFFDFCRRALHHGGYLSHKYRADGALGSSWHTYVHDTGVAPPIQTDETALVLFVFSQYYYQHASERLLNEYYESFVKPMASFLADYIDKETQLPLPSYDLWEENFMVSTYTTSVTHAALVVAAEMAEHAHDAENAVSWRTVAENMKLAANEQLFSEERQALRKGLRRTNDGYETDDTLDLSASFGPFMFGLFDENNDFVEKSFESMCRRFDQNNAHGLPRYEGDNYHRASDDSDGNYWHITTMWYAQYLIEKGDREAAKSLIDWSVQHSYPSGVMAEQIKTTDGFSTSVAPLAWSHAEFMATVLDYIAGEQHTS